MRVYAPAGHRLRYELEESWARDPISGSELGVKNVLQTQADMQNAIFCVCPPGVLPSGARAFDNVLLTQANMLSWLATKSPGCSSASREVPGCYYHWRCMWPVTIR